MCDGVQGSFDGRAVAVKRVLREFVAVAEQEVALLRRADHHPHVVRYFCLEHDGDFAYIALQLCVATLVQVRACYLLLPSAAAASCGTA